MDILKYLRECRADMIADGMEMDDSAAYDMAESLLNDLEFFAAAKKQWPGKSEQILREIVADRL